jgi:molybdopterin-guanine dinucleotide biosynthesis protein A
LERAAETLAGVVPDVIIVSSRELPATRWPRVPDARAGRGPLAGIEAALMHAEATGRPGAFVLACDMPLVDEATVRSILDGLGDHLAAAPAADGGAAVEPLCAAYRVECLPAVTDALDRDRLAAHEMFATVGGIRIALPAERFLNVNTPGDHARAATVLSGTKRY